MAKLGYQPTLTHLKQAVEIAEKIQRLETELESLLSGISGATVPAAGKRRGRPPGAVKSSPPEAPAATKVRKKRVMSEEGRQRIIEAQKKRWAAKKKGR